MAAEYHALQVPPPGETKGGIEVLRCAIIDQQLHLTVRRAFDDPRGWGQLLADVAEHAVRVYGEEGKSAAEVRSQIRAQFNEVMDEQANSPSGSTSKLR